MSADERRGGEQNWRIAVVIERESAMSRPHHPMTVVGAGKGNGLNLLPAFFGVHQLSRAYSGDFLLVQVSSGCWKREKHESLKRSTVI